MSDDNAEAMTDLTTPMMPTGNDPVDLAFASEDDQIAKNVGGKAAEGYWNQNAELHRRHDDDATAPDAPVRLGTTKTAEGKLGDMVDQWSAFTEADRQRYVIYLGGGSLTYSTLESFRQHPRDQAG